MGEEALVLVCCISRLYPIRWRGNGRYASGPCGWLTDWDSLVCRWCRPTCVGSWQLWNLASWTTLTWLPPLQGQWTSLLLRWGPPFHWKAKFGSCMSPPSVFRNEIPNNWVCKVALMLANRFFGRKQTRKPIFWCNRLIVEFLRWHW